MALLANTTRNQYLLLIAALLVLTVVNYSEISFFAPIRMNDFFSGFFLGALISLAPIGLYYKKFKK